MGCIIVSVSRLGGISAVVESEGGIGLQAVRRGGIEFSVSLICAIGAGRHLRVKPQEPLWIDVGSPDTWTVTSNVDWTIT